MISLHFKTKMIMDLLRDDLLDNGWNVKKLFGKSLLAFKYLFKRMKVINKILFKDFVCIKQVEMVLTTKCSLKCKECANLMQYYEKPYDIDVDIIKRSFDNLLGKIDRLGNFVLIGGEPFLSKNLYWMIDMAADSSKVNKITIFTNGTIIPKDDNEIIGSLSNPKVLIIISDYGPISRKKFELVEFCKKNGIRYYLKNEDLVWGFVGKPEPRSRSEQELERQFHKCKNKCRSILNGKLYYCPRASHGDDLNIIKTPKNNYVDLLNNSVKIEDILKIIYSNKFFAACDYCNYGTEEMISIIPAEQMRMIKSED